MSTLVVPVLDREKEADMRSGYGGLGIVGVIVVVLIILWLLGVIHL